MNRSTSLNSPAQGLSLSPSSLAAMCVAAIIVLSFIAYWPALTGDFLWDDDYLLTNNPLIKAPDGLFSIWFTSEPIDFWPVTNSTFWIEWRLWGMNPVGYHVTNLLLHIGASLLVWLVLRELSLPGAFLAALLFAVHPVNVEAVAWIAQRKTILALVFFLLSIWCYLKLLSTDDSQPRANYQRLYPAGAAHWYWLSLGAFILSMLSKGSTAILPLVLLLITWWRHNRFTWRDAARAAPFALVAIPLVVVNVWFQTHESGEIIRSAGFLERVLGAAAAVWFYLSKALLPVHLMFVYPQWDINVADVRWWLPLVAAVAVTVALWWWRDTPVGRPLLFAWAFFCVTLVPALGFVDVYFMKYSLVADHYQNIALVGVMALVAAGWRAWYERAPEVAIITAAMLVLALLAISFGQATNYRDAETLWRTTIDKNPNCWMAYNNLGGKLITENRSQEAMEPIEAAIRIKPDYAEAENNLGFALFNLNRLPEAITHFERALQLKPGYQLAHNNLGQVLLNQNRLPEAIHHFQGALEAQPDYADAHNNLAGALARAGRAEEALVHCRKAVELLPSFTAAHANLGNILLGLGRPQEAITSFEKAAQLRPDFAEIQGHWGLALLSISRPREAIEQFQEAVRINPELTAARYNLAIALLSLDRPQEAIAHLEELVRRDPQDATVRANLGSALLNTGRPTEAVNHLQEAVRLQPDQPDTHCNLGRALSQAGRDELAVAQFEEAVRLKPDFAEAWANLADSESQLNHAGKAVSAAQKALDLARAGGQTVLAKQIEARLTALQSGESQPAAALPSPELPPP